MSGSLGLTIINLKWSIFKKNAFASFFLRNSLIKVRHLKPLKLKKNYKTLQGLRPIEKKCRFLCNLFNSPEKRILLLRLCAKSGKYCRSKVLNHIQTALVLISCPGIFLGTFDVGSLRGLGNPHPVSGHNVKTDMYHTLQSNTVKLMQF